MSAETTQARPAENLAAELEWLRTRIGHISAAAERSAVEAEQLPGTTAREVARVFRVIAVMTERDNALSENARLRRRGTCGDHASLLLFGGDPVASFVCDLPHGHEGWHGCEGDGARWTQADPLTTADIEAVAANLAAVRSKLAPDHPEDWCHRCFGPNVMWNVASPLWNAVMRGGSINGTESWSGIICPTCFAHLAEELSIADTWGLAARRVHVELETTTPSGRTWDEAVGMWVEPDVEAVDGNG